MHKETKSTEEILAWMDESFGLNETERERLEAFYGDKHPGRCLWLEESPGASDRVVAMMALYEFLEGPFARARNGGGVWIIAYSFEDVERIGALTIKLLTSEMAEKYGVQVSLMGMQTEYSYLKSVSPYNRYAGDGARVSFLAYVGVSEVLEGRREATFTTFSRNVTATGGRKLLVGTGEPKEGSPAARITGSPDIAKIYTLVDERA